MKLAILVQAHHENWGGGRSYCLSEVQGKPVIAHVLKKIRDRFPELPMVVAVPNEIENRCFEQFGKESGASVYFGSKANVLDRLIKAAESVGCDAFIRIIGEHYFVNLDYVESLLASFQSGDYDIVTPPLDFDPKFGAEVVSVDSFKHLSKILTGDSQSVSNALANPLHYMTSHQDKFRHLVNSNVPSYKDAEIQRMREIAKGIYLEAYEHKAESSELSGDLLRMHYEIAKKYISGNDSVLDIACGDGWGSEILASAAGSVIGADLSKEFIDRAKKRCRGNVSFQVQDALRTDFADESFDVVISMETIEHVDDDKGFIREMHRILKKNGIFIVSTPQNAAKSSPLIPYHVREYNLQDFKSLLVNLFGIKQFYTFRSNLVLAKEEIGNGMMVVCERKG